ncbi:MAG: SDR family NAD(P)-dependent oxidoreductase [Rhodobacteraceae bacterium]|nr:SDR family NAD(P)-dependent oxidoreductase [Paracoccaceae bacterium]
MKTILITGCSSGIGYDAAHTLHKRGWRVFATCRQEADCERLRGEGLESFQLDYADEASIEAAVAEVLTRTDGTLDALFNNGAYAIPGATEDLPRDALRAVFEVNVFGQFDLIARLLPAMRPAGRVVNCSSVLAIAALRMRGAYCATKFAMEAMTDALRYENYHTELKVISIQPGPIPTRIRANSIPHFEKWIDWENSAHRATYEGKLIPRLYDETGEPDRFQLPCSAVTDALIKAIEAPNPKPRYMVTKATAITEITRRFLPKRLLDRIYAGM